MDALSVFIGTLQAKQIAHELWELTLEGIEDGDLTAPNSIEDAFKAGVLSLMALVHIQMDAEQHTVEKASRN